jgi:hypothetical protein
LTALITVFMNIVSGGLNREAGLPGSGRRHLDPANLIGSQGKTSGVENAYEEHNPLFHLPVSPYLKCPIPGFNPNSCTKPRGYYQTVGERRADLGTAEGIVPALKLD